MWDLIGSIVTGGATGLLGVAISSISQYFAQKQKHKYRLAVLVEERNTLELEIKSAERVAEIKIEGERNVADARAFGQSLESDRRSYSVGGSRWLIFVDVVRGLVRPVLTLYLCGLVSVFYFITESVLFQHRILITVLYVTTAAVLWWFGSRAKQPE